MLILGVSSSAVQITSSSATGGIAPYCCSDPGCPCEGGRAAKAALESKQLEENRDQVRISAEALNILTSESAREAAEPITTQAPAPVYEIVPGAFPESTYVPIDSQARKEITNYLDARSLDESYPISRTGQLINDFA